MVALYDSEDPELAHNGRRIDELGLGANAGASIEAAVEAASKLKVDGVSHTRCRAAIAGRDRDGLAQSVAWLVERLSGGQGGQGGQATAEVTSAATP